MKTFVYLKRIRTFAPLLKESASDREALEMGSLPCLSAK